MGGADQGMGVLVEEVLPEDELYVFVLLRPDLLRQFAEGTVEVGVGKLRLDLGQIAVLEGLLEHSHGVERHRHVHVGFGRMIGRPNVTVTEDAQLAQVFLLVPEPDGLGDGFHHLVMGLGRQAHRVHGHGDDGRMDGTELGEDGFYIALAVGRPNFRRLRVFARNDTRRRNDT